VETERENAHREISKSWIERYPGNKQLPSAQIDMLLNDYANDHAFIISAINILPAKLSSGYPVDYKLLQAYCKKGIGGVKKKNQVKGEIGFEEDSHGNLTQLGQHKKMMYSDWQLPVIEDFDPKNPQHLTIQADYLFRTGQIGEKQYEWMMIGIKIISGEIDLEDKLHVVIPVDKDIPF